MPSSDDLPTPEPAKIPSRWPRPQGTSVSSARTPSGRRVSIMRARAASRAASATVERCIVGLERAARRRSAGRGRRARARAARRRPSSSNGARRSAITRLPGRDPAHLAERHQQRLAVAEADHLGRDRARRRPGSIEQRSPTAAARPGRLDHEPDHGRARGRSSGTGRRRRARGRGLRGARCSSRRDVAPEQVSRPVRAGSRSARRSRPRGCERRSRRGRSGARRRPRSCRARRRTTSRIAISARTRSTSAGLHLEHQVVAARSTRRSAPSHDACSDRSRIARRASAARIFSASSTRQLDGARLGDRRRPRRARPSMPAAAATSAARSGSSSASAQRPRPRRAPRRARDARPPRPRRPPRPCPGAAAGRGRPATPSSSANEYARLRDVIRPGRRRRRRRGAARDEDLAGLLEPADGARRSSTAPPRPPCGAAAA